MSDIQGVRRANLKLLLERRGGATEVAKALGLAGPSYLSQLVNGKRPLTEKAARAFEQKLSLAEHSLDRRPGEDIPFAGTDRTLLAASVRAIALAVKNANVEPNPAKFAELVALVYEQAAKAGRVDDDYVANLIKLVL